VFANNKLLQFYKRVVEIAPRNHVWSVEVEDVRSKQKEIVRYDGVIVCNGHYSSPFVPKIAGADSFAGSMKHSHDYRTRDCYKDKRVLVLGAGPSGLDISQQIHTVAAKVMLEYFCNKDKKWVVCCRFFSVTSHEQRSL
jgi:dimethylaniline monooxygenase (N-oxide forming)